MSRTSLFTLFIYKPTEYVWFWSQQICRKQDMREGKLCPERLSSWPEYKMFQSFFLLLMHECFYYFFHCFKGLSGRKEKHPSSSGHVHYLLGNLLECDIITDCSGVSTIHCKGEEKKKKKKALSIVLLASKKSI